MLPYICRNVWGEGDEYICFSNNMRIQYCMYVRIHTVYINNIHILYLIMVYIYIYIYTCFYSIYILYLHSYTHVQCTTRMKSTFLSLWKSWRCSKNGVGFAGSNLGSVGIHGPRINVFLPHIIKEWLKNFSSLFLSINKEMAVVATLGNLRTP